MEQVQSLDQLRQLSAEIRSLHRGFLTNFFFDTVKHGLWIAKNDCYFERVGSTLFIIKISHNFWNVFYSSTNLDEFSIDLSAFLADHPDTVMMFDIVGRAIQCQPVVEVFRGKGCKEATSLVRMTRMTASMEYVADSTIRRAEEKDVKEIGQLLHTYFDEQTEQIPYDEELEDYVRQGHVLVCEEQGRMMGFLIYELNASTLYLRYWFTHPNFRDRKVGSRLLRRFFEEGKDTKRQLFWVIRSNENAIKRYKHYGFTEENMNDFIMQFDNNANNMNDNMREQIIKILTELRPEFDFTQEGIDFIEEGMLDSFDMVNLVNDLDSTFGISIDGVDILPENFGTIDSIELLLKKNGAK